MSKNIIIAVLVFLCMICMIYAFIQQSVVVKIQAQAEQNLILAIENEKKAVMNREEALRQAKLATEQLRLCAERK